MKICPHCQKKLLNNYATYCVYCGAAIADAPVVPASETTESTVILPQESSRPQTEPATLQPPTSQFPAQLVQPQSPQPNEEVQKAMDYMRNGRNYQIYTMAANIFQRYAMLGDPIAKTCLADCYRSGYGVEQNVFKAVKLYEEAAQLGYANAQYKLGEMCIDGMGMKRDVKTGIQYLEKAAEQGQVAAIHRLAKISFDPDDWSVRYDMPFALFNKLAPTSPQAKFYLATCYMRGKDVPQDTRRASQLILEAANEGDMNAQFVMGEMCERGGLFEKNVEVAVKWYQVAAQQGHQEAMRRCSYYQQAAAQAAFNQS